MRVGLMCFRIIELSAIIHADASEVIVYLQLRLYNLYDSG